MGRLYVVGAPVADPEDLTLRALRILSEAVLVVADDLLAARRLLAHHGVAASPLPLVDLVRRAGGNPILDLPESGDVVLLLAGPSPAPSGASADLITAALERGWTVVPVPGPALPVTALVLSGLPTDGFAYLDRLPPAPAARSALLVSVASERRTLVALESLGRLVNTLGTVAMVLGDRPVALMMTSEQGQQVWRGTSTQVREVAQALLSLAATATDECVLVIGGASAQQVRWQKDRLAAEIQARLQQGWGARLVSQQLAAESGWSRREIYRLVVAASQFPPDS